MCAKVITQEIWILSVYFWNIYFCHKPLIILLLYICHCSLESREGGNNINIIIFQLDFAGVMAYQLIGGNTAKLC